MTFVRDAQGRVTGYTYHRWDGQEIHAKKIKRARGLVSCNSSLPALLGMWR